MLKDSDRQFIIRDVIIPVQEYFVQSSKITFHFYTGGGKLLSPNLTTGDFYRVLLKSQEGRQHLREPRNRLIKKAARTGRAHIGVCHFTGLLLACVPIRHQGSPVGYWVLGQTILPHEERSYQYYDQYLREISGVIGLHLYPLRKLMYQLPEVSQDVFLENVALVDAATARLLQSWQARTAKKAARMQVNASAPGLAAM